MAPRGSQTPWRYPGALGGLSQRAGHTARDSDLGKRGQLSLAPPGSFKVTPKVILKLHSILGCQFPS